MTEVTSVADLLDYLNENFPPNEDRWFRGHAHGAWDLSASVFRTPSRQANEVVLLKRFIQEAKRHIQEVPSTEWDWVFLAQHHEVPTRLLDWSENPLVGLFFAAQDHLDIPENPETARDGALWVLKPTVLNQAAGRVGQGARDLPLFGIDHELDEYSPFAGGEIRKPPLAALAARNFARISVQWGTFTISNFPDALDVMEGHQDYIDQLTVPLSAKPHIRVQLERLGLEGRTIYPDLFRLGRRLAEVFG